MGLIDGILGSLFPPSATPIGDLVAGRLVTIRGHVIPRDIIVAPLTGKPCIYYRFASFVWRQSQVTAIAGDGFWETRGSDEAIAEFYLSDETGQAIIAPGRVQVEFARSVAEDSFEHAVNERATERRIVLGDTVEATGIVGIVADLHDEGRLYRSAPERPILRAPADAPLLIRVTERKPIESGARGL